MGRSWPPLSNTVSPGQLKKRSGQQVERYVHIDEVGPVLFEKSRRARRIILSVRPFKGIRVAIPYRCSYAEAEEFVYSRLDWLQRHMKDIKRLEEEQQNWLELSQGINRSQARKIIVHRLQELATQHGFSFNRVSVRNQRTRWGSCSAQNNLNLNVKMVLLPPELMDYVILHELVHIRVKNHGKKFWEELDKYVGDAKALRRRLNTFKIGLLNNR